MEIKLKRYEAYKDSGVEWLGEIPENWEVKPGFTILKEGKEKNKGFVEKTILSLSYGKVIIKPEEKLTGLVPESFETYQLVTPGDIIIRPTDLQNDVTSLRTGLAKNKGIITSAYINLRVIEKYSNVFYHYYLHTIDINKVIYGLGSGLRQNISFLDFKRFPFPLPSLIEQTSIAKFLDDKTFKIDQAISIKQKQIGLLKERRQILIHKAVTQGINPNVKLKNSGVEWIGKIPEHWELTKAKYYSTIFVPERAKPELNFEREGIAWVTTENLRKEELFEVDVLSYVSKASIKKTKSRIIEKNSVIATCVGNFGIASKLNFDAIINQQIQGYTNLKIDAYYLVQIITLSEDYFKNNSTLTTIMYVNKDTFGSLPILLPPKIEQLQIIDFLKKASTKISTAISLKEKEIEKLMEYKASLINSVVTGKVRVS